MNCNSLIHKRKKLGKYRRGLWHVKISASNCPNKKSGLCNVVDRALVEGLWAELPELGWNAGRRKRKPSRVELDLKRAEAERDRIVEAVGKGALEGHEISERIEPVRERISRLREQQLAEKAPPPELDPGLFDYAAKQDPSEVPQEKMKELIKLAVKQIDHYPGKLEVALITGKNFMVTF